MQIKAIAPAGASKPAALTDILDLLLPRRIGVIAAIGFLDAPFTLRTRTGDAAFEPILPYGGFLIPPNDADAPTPVIVSAGITTPPCRPVNRAIVLACGLNLAKRRPGIFPAGSAGSLTATRAALKLAFTVTQLAPALSVIGANTPLIMLTETVAPSRSAQSAFVGNVFTA